MHWVQGYVGAVLCLIYVGVIFRRKRKIHVPIMLASFVLDMTAVIYLEFNRGVVMKAFEKVSEYMFQIHLTFAIATLVGYGIALYTGTCLLRGLSMRRLHKINAVFFLIARTGVFITSLFIM